MSKFNIGTMVALIVTIVAVTVLTALGKPVPAAMSAILGSLWTAVQPALMKGGE